MPTRRTQASRIADLYDRAVTELVEAHAKLKRDPLVLAVRYGADDNLDVNLLEIIENFPGSSDEPPFSSQFSSNERLRILGKLNLVLASPKQMSHAIDLADSDDHSKAGKDARRLVEALRSSGRVVFQAEQPRTRSTAATTILRKLRLP